MLSKRERTIAIIAGASVVTLGLYYYVVAPLWESSKQLATQRENLQAKVSQADRTFTRDKQSVQRWKDFRAAGLVGDAPATESNLLKAMGTWSQEAGLPLQSIRPDRVSGSEGLHELTFQVTADGSMRAIAGFLYRIESAAMPVRIHELQIASRTEGSDDLSLQLRISTLWEDQRPPVAAAAAAVPQKGQP